MIRATMSGEVACLEGGQAEATEPIADREGSQEGGDRGAEVAVRE